MPKRKKRDEELPSTGPKKSKKSTTKAKDLRLTTGSKKTPKGVTTLLLHEPKKPRRKRVVIPKSLRLKPRRKATPKKSRRGPRK